MRKYRAYQRLLLTANDLPSVVDRLPLNGIHFVRPFSEQLVDLSFPWSRRLRLPWVPLMQTSAALPDVGTGLRLGATRKAQYHRLPVVGFSIKSSYEIVEGDWRELRPDSSLP